MAFAHKYDLRVRCVVAPVGEDPVAFAAKLEADTGEQPLDERCRHGAEDHCAGHIAEVGDELAARSRFHWNEPGQAFDHRAAVAQ